MKYTSKTTALASGIKLSYVEQGASDRIPMLLLHGVSDSWHSFEPVLPYLPPSIHAFAVSQRGHGDSDRPERYRTRDFAEDIGEFMDAVNLREALVVGHSMGSTNAQRFAIDKPGRFLGLVLAGSFPSYRDNPGIIQLWESEISKLADPVNPRFVREFQEGTVAQPVPDAFLNTVIEESLKLPALVWRRAFEGFLEDDCVGELYKIKAPTLILWGARDTLCRRSDEDELLAAIAGSRLIVYESAGHALHWEEPERFAADLVAFATEVAPEALPA
ncbi:MAG: alpha/beta hydrolase [Acidobacteria bacterium]|nr:MAG: alpha/beta hydrolase [Acidobacteriota bacterium]